MTEQEIYQYIEMTPFRGREPIFRGTNIQVMHIIEDFATGMDFDEVLKQHPLLTRKHLQAAFGLCRMVFKENDALRLRTTFFGF